MSRIVKEWIGQRVVVKDYQGEEVGVLLEQGSCWVVWRLTDENGAEHEEYRRVGARDTIRLAIPTDKPWWQRWREQMAEQASERARQEAGAQELRRSRGIPAEFDPFTGKP